MYFFALLATTFGHFGHHQANIVQKFKKGWLHIVRIMLGYMGSHFVGPVSQSVLRLTRGWTVRDRIPVGTRFSTRPDRPWGPPSLP
jgi:hypothetical protein